MAVDIRAPHIDECVLVQDPVELVSRGVGVLVVPDDRAGKSVCITRSVRIYGFIDIVPVVHAHVPQVISELEGQLTKTHPLLMFDIKMLFLCFAESPLPQFDILQPNIECLGIGLCPEKAAAVDKEPELVFDEGSPKARRTVLVSM